LGVLGLCLGLELVAPEAEGRSGMHERIQDQFQIVGFELRFKILDCLRKLLR
jgi:hypothetical protein